MNTKLLALLKSRRLWIAVVGVIAIVGEEALGLDPEQVVVIGGIIIAWILGDAIRKT